jgi:hypothetical protein
MDSIISTTFTDGYKTGGGRGLVQAVYQPPLTSSNSSAFRSRSSPICVPAFMIPVPFLVAGPADALRSDSTAIAPLNVKALTTSPPTIGDVAPGAAAQCRQSTYA